MRRVYGMKADAIVQQTLTAMQSLGLASEDVLLGRASIHQRFEEKDNKKTRRFSHYELTQRLTIVLKDIHRYNGLCQAIAPIQGLSSYRKFAVTRADSVRCQLQTDALRAARQKAANLAGAAGASVGKVLSLSEFVPNPTQEQFNRLVNRHVMVSNNIWPEGIFVEFKIYAVFALE